MTSSKTIHACTWHAAKRKEGVPNKEIKVYDVRVEP